MNFDSIALLPDEIDFARYRAEVEPVVRVLPAEAYADDVVAAFYPPPGARSPSFCWPKAEGKLEFRPEEVSIWMGINGHGKSLLLGQQVLEFCRRDHRCCVASMEMRPAKTLERMVRQLTMGSRPSDQAIRESVAWLGGRLWLYDQQGMVTPDQLFAVIRYAATELEVRQFVVDNLMKVCAAEDDYNEQKRVVDMLCMLARDLHIHIHIVHHVRKGESEAKVPGKYDARGSGTITDQVDNVLVVWRRKPKPGEELPENEPNALLAVEKQRNGDGWEGRIALWFDRRSWQFCGTDRREPVDFRGVLRS